MTLTTLTKNSKEDWPNMMITQFSNTRTYPINRMTHPIFSNVSTISLSWKKISRPIGANYQAKGPTLNLFNLHTRLKRIIYCWINNTSKRWKYWTAKKNACMNLEKKTKPLKDRLKTSSFNWSKNKIYWKKMRSKRCFIKKWCFVYSG